MGNREKVLEAATALFGQVGYQAASVDSILDSAKVSPSNFYYHFKSKEALAIEVLEGYFERSRQEIAPLFMNRSLSASEKLERLHESIVKKLTARGCCGGCPMGNLAQELSDTHPEFRVRLSAYFDECVDALARLVGEGMKAGEFRQDLDPRSVGLLLFGSMEGLLLLSKTMKKTEPMELGWRMSLKLLKE